MKTPPPRRKLGALWLHVCLFLFCVPEAPGANGEKGGTFRPRAHTKLIPANSTCVWKWVLAGLSFPVGGNWSLTAGFAVTLCPESRPSVVSGGAVC